MTMLAYAVVGVVLLAALVLWAHVFRTMRRARFGITTICPKTGKRVRVKLDPKRAVGVLFLVTQQRVVDCEQWRERGECERDCEPALAPV